MNESVGYLAHGVGELDPDRYEYPYEKPEQDPDIAYDEWRERQYYND